MLLLKGCYAMVEYFESCYIEGCYEGRVAIERWGSDPKSYPFFLLQAKNMKLSWWELYY